MTRVVLDTNVILSGLRSRNGASFAILRLVAERRIFPLVSTTLFLEYESVLMRPEHRRMTGLNADDLGLFLREFAALCRPVEIHFLWRPQLRDPKDEMVLEVAVNGRADRIITFNRRDFEPAVQSFNIQVCEPGAFIRGFLA